MVVSIGSMHSRNPFYPWIWDSKGKNWVRDGDGVGEGEGERGTEREREFPLILSIGYKKLQQSQFEFLFLSACTKQPDRAKKRKKYKGKIETLTEYGLLPFQQTLWYRWTGDTGNDWVTWLIHPLLLWGQRGNSNHYKDWKMLNRSGIRNTVNSKLK